MAKGCKGIRHIRDDVYFLDYQVGKVRKQCRVRAESQKEAKALRLERIVELRKVLPFVQGEKERLGAGFGEAWQKLEADLESDGLPKKTILRYRKVFSRTFEDFRGLKYPLMKSVSEVSLTFLLEYKNYFINDLQHDPRGGLKTELICLKSMLRRLRKLGFCRKELIDSLDEIKRPRPSKKAYPTFSNSKMREMLDFIKSNRADYYALIYYLARTGRRINESILIQRKDVEWQGLKPIRINIVAETTKSKEEAPLEKIDDDLARVIKMAYSVSSRHKAPYLFISRLKKKFSDSKVRDYLKTVSKRMLGVAITPHFFRHRFLTECGKAQISMVDAMRIAGIKDIGVVSQYYSHSTQEGQDKVLAVTKI